MKQKTKKSSKNKKDFSFAPQLKDAFAELRTLGFFAKENHSCCGGCGWSAMSADEAKNAVFYHNQDLDDLKEDNTCYLAWSGDAKKIIEVLNKHNIKTDWNGETSSRIHITVPKDFV